MKCFLENGRVIVCHDHEERPDFAIGEEERTRAFAEYLVAQGAATDVEWTFWYLHSLPKDLEGELCIPEFDPDDAKQVKPPHKRGP